MEYPVLIYSLSDRVAAVTPTSRKQTIGSSNLAVVGVPCRV